MLIKDLDGQTHKWLLTGHMSKGKIINRSSLHLQARKLIASTYPTLQILEEVPITIRKNEILYLDFYLPLKKNMLRSTWRTALQIHSFLSQ